MNIFSIVIPVHNKESYLKKTLNCILNQTYTHFELILVNDGSKDLSGNICDKYAASDSRIKVIHQKNGGVSNARNNGIKAASNELIAFIDADDFWSLDFLMQMNEMILSINEVDIYSSKYATIQNGEIIQNENFFEADGEFVIFDLIKKCAEKARFPIHASSVIIKKKAIEKAGFYDERISTFEDFDLFVRIALHSKIAYLNREPLSFYNLDVPAESKARGTIPKFEKNWIHYFDKFENESKRNKKLKLLIDRSILTQLIGYNKYPELRKSIKQYLTKVDAKNFSLKYKLIYYSPPLIGRYIMNVYKILIKIFRH